MYHDEFAKPPSRPIPSVQGAPSTLPMEVGGGISLGLAASLNPSLTLVLFYLGGLLPLVVWSMESAARRAAEFLAGLAPRREVARASIVPASHFRIAPSRANAPHRRPAMAGMTRSDGPGFRRPLG